MSKNNLSEIESIKQKIHDREPFHVQFPTCNKFVFNKIVPYIFVYRSSKENTDNALKEIGKFEFSYIRIKDNNFDTSWWISSIAQKLTEEFGACLIVEIWIADQDQTEDIQICISRKQVQPLAKYLEKQLLQEDCTPLVGIHTNPKLARPEHLPPLYDILDKANHDLFYIGLRVKRDPWIGDKNMVIPTAKRYFSESLSRSLSKTFFEFLRIYTTYKSAEFKINYKKKLAPLILDIDQKLAEESRKFDFLLLITPINTNEAWLKFKKDNFRQAPIFRYRPMPFDPDLVKRNLYNLRVEDISDPTIAYIFRDKRKEMDHMMGMLLNRGKADFMHGSLQVFGNVGHRLLDKAKAILTITEKSIEITPRNEDIVDAREFVEYARAEIAYLKQQCPDFDATIRLRDDCSGIMVSKGVLNINKQFKLPRQDIKALIQHEIGTHIVTYFNGKQQPLNLFKYGVPGYEKLQEGLAVLSEYMIGGLNNKRLRTLAARVVAVDHMLMGNSFTDTFALLIEQYKLNPEHAFTMTMRIYRSGGFTKDALYLHGLINLIQYINNGNDLNLLMIGKIHEDYIPIVHELIIRGILKEPILKPRYLNEPYINTLTKLKESNGVFEMIL